jgi:hypothetical protein
MARQVHRSACAAFVFMVLAAPAAAADGLPVGNVDAGPTGATAPGSDARYVTLGAQAGTVVAKVRRDGGQVLRSRFLKGNFTVPGVALDGSAAGLSADRTTLSLIRPRAGFPQARTKLLVLDATRLQVQRRITLRGDFSFDAISPDGATLYLIQYLSRRDPTRYAVRAYDVSTGRLVPDAIVDPREPEERMGGYPVTRAYSADGRWAYTLYDGAGKHPFVHALDTMGRTAACIDLDGLSSRRDVYALRLAVDDAAHALTIVDHSAPVAVIDTRTFRVQAPATADQGGDGISQTLLWAAAVVAALACAGTLSRAVRRRRRLARA